MKDVQKHHPSFPFEFENANTIESPCLHFFVAQSYRVKGRVKPGHCGGVKLDQLVAAKLLDLRGRRGSGA
jgi:hypothetical protein